MNGHNQAILTATQNALALFSAKIETAAEAKAFGSRIADSASYLTQGLYSRFVTGSKTQATPQSETAIRSTIVTSLTKQSQRVLGSLSEEVPKMILSMKQGLSKLPVDTGANALISVSLSPKLWPIAYILLNAVPSKSASVNCRPMCDGRNLMLNMTVGQLGTTLETLPEDIDSLINPILRDLGLATTTKEAIATCGLENVVSELLNEAVQIGRAHV